MHDNFIEITDLYLAVFLKSKYRLKITDIRKEDNRITFVFDLDGHDGQDLIRSYYNGRDKISANDFVKEIKDLKALIHNYSM